MKRFLYIIIIIVFFILPISAKSQGSHYLGVNINFGSYYTDPRQYALEIGFGLEYGITRDHFFLGIEGGFYGIAIPEPVNYDEPVIFNGNPYNDYPILEEYLGIHGGFIVNDWLWFGIVVLVSTTEEDHYSFAFDSINKTWHTNETIKHPIFFNLGPDLRFSASSIITINTAFTVRRGLKLGASYFF